MDSPARFCAAVFAAAALLCSPGDVCAWGAATHAWIAGRVLRSTSPDTLYGSVLPDLAWLSQEGGPLPLAVSRLTHRRPSLLRRAAPEFALEELAAGFATHGVHRGADRTAHRVGIASTRGYAIRKAARLAPSLVPGLAGELDAAGVPFPSLAAAQAAPTLAHALVETAVDLLLARELSPGIGGAISGAAEARQLSVPGLLAAAYAGPAAENAGVGAEEAAAFLGIREEAHREDIRRYGPLLDLPPGEAEPALAGLGAALASERLSAAFGRAVILPQALAEEWLALAKACVAGSWRREVKGTVILLKEHFP